MFARICVRPLPLRLQPRKRPPTGDRPLFFRLFFRLALPTMPYLDLPGGVHMRYERMSSSDPDPGAHDKPLLVVVVPFT